MFGHYFMYPCVAIYLFSVIFVHGCVALRHRFGRTPKEYQKVVQEPNKSKTWMRGTMKNVRVFREWHKTFNTFWHFWLTNFKSFWQTKGEQQRAEERERERCREEKTSMPAFKMRLRCASSVNEQNRPGILSKRHLIFIELSVAFLIMPNMKCMCVFGHASNGTWNNSHGFWYRKRQGRNRFFPMPLWVLMMFLLAVSGHFISFHYVRADQFASVHLHECVRHGSFHSIRFNNYNCL